MPADMGVLNTSPNCFWDSRISPRRSVCPGEMLLPDTLKMGKPKWGGRISGGMQQGGSLLACCRRPGDLSTPSRR